MNNKNILLVGVGGQGTITAAKLLTTGLIENGYDVKMSEIHGMSQRGGSVSTQVRFGEAIQSPVIELGTADVIVAFEKMEAMRYLDYLKEGGLIIVNDHEIWPLSVVINKADYPQHLIEKLENKTRTLKIDAQKMATALGNPKVANVILLGVLVKALSLQGLDWDKILKDTVKKQWIDLNSKAFQQGVAAFNE
ncbi:MAG: indolepyruvate oxidoreductase subunit beta [Eubacteriaceae bacterium]|jgi:indolepyruvate ferredoxin oxidoreductase beta subunit|nr:indolepyruvate oxidoreductase subunit beta [Eubacteriaceae bacterium]